MTYSKVYVLGDSLVDSGNALKLANWYGGLPFTSLPEGAPYPSDGYYLGRFSDGYTYADLISNKLVGQVTKPVFPYHFEDPWLGVPISPFASDPSGVAINFAYGGSQINQGSEVVPDLDGQTDALKDAVDNRFDPNALVIVTIGGNDVRSLAPGGRDPVPEAEARAILDAAATRLQGELGGLIARGASNILITGIPDVGLIPRYDDNGNLMLDGAEIVRSEAATAYALYLDNLIQTVVVPALEALGANVTYVPVADWASQSGSFEQGALSAILPTIAALNDLGLDELRDNMLEHQQLIFFDQIHPTGQVHALVGSYMYAQLTGSDWVETLPLAGADVDFRVAMTIGAVGEVDTLSFALLADTEYRFDMLGISSLGTFGALADPLLRIMSADGTVIGTDDDSGAGFDSSLSLILAETGLYTVSLSAVGAVTGHYLLQATVLGGAAMAAGNTYVVHSAMTLVLEGAGGAGQDTIAASVSYSLYAGSEIEVLRTTDDKGRSAIDLRGNEFDQVIVGNNGDNVLDGRGGSDTYYGGGGKDVFVLAADGSVDRIADYGKGDLIDVRGVLSVATGTDIVGGGYLRVTEGGLVQVDPDGGANDWVTLATVGSSSAYSFLYLSGGSSTQLDISGGGASGGPGGGKGRGKNSTAITAGAIGAFGLVLIPAPEQGAMTFAPDLGPQSATQPAMLARSIDMDVVLQSDQLFTSLLKGSTSGSAVEAADVPVLSFEAGDDRLLDNVVAEAAELSSLPPASEPGQSAAEVGRESIWADTLAALPPQVAEALAALADNDKAINSLLDLALAQEVGPPVEMSQPAAAPPSLAIIEIVSVGDMAGFGLPPIFDGLAVPQSPDAPVAV